MARESPILSCNESGNVQCEPIHSPAHLAPNCSKSNGVIVFAEHSDPHGIRRLALEYLAEVFE